MLSINSQGAPFMKRTNLKSKLAMAFALLVVLFFGIGLAAIFSGHVQAQAIQKVEVKNQGSGIVPADNAACLACHNAPDRTLSFPNGDTTSVTINSSDFNASVHSSMNCTTCHPTISGFPHPALVAQGKRDYIQEYKDTCQTCHPDNFKQSQDSVHSQALTAGNKNAPSCSDCHNPHTQGLIKDDKGNLLPSARAQIPLTCAKCHNAIFTEYASSVHGKGVLEANNPDVPTCTTCHGVHSIANPTTAAFRNNSIQLCASCHTNRAIMDKYGISTQVLNTYVADFHGTTVTLFASQSPGEMSNKPVCYDCHGIHNIASVKDPKNGLEIKQNLLAACKRCHSDANTNFPDAWLSHYIPSQTRYPLVYYVNLFYKYFIPLVLGGMALFILTDIFRRVRARRKPRQVEISAVEEQPE
jgi:predicted CXXCH cytochrome family protein